MTCGGGGPPARGSGLWGFPGTNSVSAFVAAFESLGYEVCESGFPEPGYEKVALYVCRDARGKATPTHAARQLPSGRWTSKLGAAQDIEHERAEDVNGPAYGAPEFFLKRAL